MKSKKQRRDEAEARRKIREERGDLGQLRWLEANGHGSTREAAKLRRKLGKKVRRS
jgi:hypothetical protein